MAEPSQSTPSNHSGKGLPPIPEMVQSPHGVISPAALSRFPNRPMKTISLPLSISTVYLLPCQGGYLQIDTGYTRDYPLYLKKLAQAGVKLTEIKYLLLTHHHDDHAGFLNELTQATDVIIMAHEQAKALLKSGQNDRTRGGGWVSGRIKLFMDVLTRLGPPGNSIFPPFELRATDWLVSGDEPQLLQRVGLAGKILYTPGHCIDHLALALEDGNVYCGDAASSFLLPAGAQYCGVFMTDMEACYQSWQKILAAGARQLYPGHGQPFPAEKLRQNMHRIRTSDLRPMN